MTPAPALAFLQRALVAARTNAAWPALRPLAGLLDASAPARVGALGPPAAVDARTGLPPYALWARLKADQTLAREDGAHTSTGEPLAVLEARALTSPTHAARLARRRYHEALRGLPFVRLADLDVAQKSALERGGRRVLAQLDKIEVDGVIVRVGAELALDRSVTDRALYEVLFAHSASFVEETLQALVALPGVRAVERVARGAVEQCAVADAGVCPAPWSALAGAARAAVCTFGFSVCALDVTAGANDLLAPDAPTLPRDLPHRVFRDRKVVATRAAAAVVRARVAAAGTRTLVYEVDDESADAIAAEARAAGSGVGAA